MTDSAQHETKEKIIGVAMELFSKFGFNGTSVRDIAQACEVNIAAINYHFGSKANLYWSVVTQCHKRGDTGFNESTTKAKSIEEAVINSFDFLMTQTGTVRTIIRLMMTEGVPEPEGDIRAKMESRSGPPGIVNFAEVLRRELGKGLPEKAINFAAQSIYFHLMQFVLARSSAKREFLKSTGDFADANIHETLKLHARAICEYIQKHKKDFS